MTAETKRETKKETRKEIREEARASFIKRFAEGYDLPGAARAAGITRGEAYGLLEDAQVCRAIDRAVVARAAGKTLARIFREYEAIAFSEGEDVRPTDRIRALEQLRQIAASASPEDEGPPALIIQYEYV